MPFSARVARFKQKFKSKTGSGNQAPTRTSDTATVTPTPPEPSVQTSVSDPIPVPPNANIEPWARAYEMALAREPDLMEAYARHLASLQGESAENTDLSVPKSVESAVEQLVKLREEKQWRLSILGKEVKIREQVERLAKFVLWSEPIVTKALSAQPYAALGWSGVTLLLPLLVGGLESNEAMLQGFNSLADVQLYWHICETRYLNGQHSQVYQELFEPLAKLYSHIIEFQACVICHLSKSQTSRAWKGMTGSNDWKGNVTAIDDLSTKCSNMIPHLEVGEVRDERDKVLHEMQQSQDILNGIRTLLETESKQNQTIHEEEKTKDLLRDLISDHTPEEYKDFNPEKVKGTCEWFLKDERFCEWRAATSPSILWVSASPGCGKSVLARALIDERRLSTSVTTSTVCYFFFKDEIERRMHATDALSVILHQIFTKHPEKGSMVQIALSDHAELGAGLTKNFSALWQIFVNCVESPNAGEIVVVLDALDECKRSSWLQLLEKLNKTYCDWNRSGSPPKLKFLITSRPYGDIKNCFRKFPRGSSCVSLDGDEKSTEISKEINLVIDARVKEIAREFKEDDRRLIADKLKSMGNRTYLWLHLTFDIIDQSPCQYSRRAAVVELLSDLPCQVSDAYEKILERSKNSIQTTTLLEIVLAAARPLTLDEANIALTLALSREVCISHASLEDELFSKSDFSDNVKNLCGLLISFHDSKLSFIHQTAREFLMHDERRGKWQGRLKISNAHIKMSLACLQYLSFLDMPSSNEWLVNNFPLADYSAKYWMEHARPVETEQEVQKTILNFFEQRGHPFVNWERLHRPKYHWLHEPHPGKLECPIYYASLGGLRHTVHSLLKESQRRSRNDGIFTTSFWAAAQNHHKDIMQLILESGAHPSYRICEEILRNVVYCGRTDIVLLLLSKASPNNSDDLVSFQFDLYRTAILSAVWSNREEMLRLLLDGANANILDGDYGKSIARASRWGYEGALRLLLERVKFNTLSHYYGRAIFLAAQNGRERILELLIGGGDPISHARHYRNALLAAAAHGHEGIVRKFLGFADINNQDASYKRYYTPFMTAATAAHPVGEIEQVVHDEDCADNFYSEKYCTAIQAAATHGHKEIVKLLIAHGADMNVQGGRKGNALHAAAYHGHKEIVQLLLAFGAEFNIHDTSYYRALQEAAANERTEIVQLFLNRAHLDDHEQAYKASVTTLKAAAANGRIKLMLLLLNQAGADILPEFCSSALEDAALHDQKEIVQLLLAHGADINFRDEVQDRSIIQTAAEHGHQRIVRLILSSGASIDDELLSDALRRAAEFGHKEILELILERVDPDILVDHGALCAAVEHGHKEIVELLLARGADAKSYGGRYGSALGASICLGLLEITQLIRDNGAVPSVW